MGENSALLFHLASIALVLTALVMGVVRHLQARQQQWQGVVWLQALRTLITHVQRHRGLAAGVLAGDHSLQQRLTEIQLQVSRDFEQIGGVGDWIKHNPSWQGITQHWARLAGNVSRLSVPHSFDQHSRLIRSILALVDDIALGHHLHSGGQRKANIWRDLLTLAEHVGQARAIGMALTAKRADQSESVCHRAYRDLQHLDQEIIAALDKPRCRSAVDERILQSMLDFLTYIDRQILSSGPQVSAAEFYQVATKTLDQLYECFDQELAAMNRRMGR